MNRIKRKSRSHITKKKQSKKIKPHTNGAKKILIIEDDPTIFNLVRAFLEKENYSVRISTNGLKGFKQALKETPDLILMDIIMPVMDGFQCLSYLKKDKELYKIPVIILTSLSQETNILKAINGGVIDYMTKPFSPLILTAKIKKLLS